jgi:hypothetical protein
MNGSSDQESNDCDLCSAEISFTMGIHTQVDSKQVLLCEKCFNKRMADHMGMSFEQIELNDITLEDCDGRKHTFKFQTHMVPTGLSIRALERVGDDIAYQFQVLGDFDCDQSNLILDLYAKIKRGISQKYLEDSDHFGQRIKDMDVVGRVCWDEEDSDRPMLWIDGKKVSWDEFGKMVTSFEGWQFKLKMIDPSDDPHE